MAQPIDDVEFIYHVVCYLLVTEFVGCGRYEK
jgi:hypothetical protein